MGMTRHRGFTLIEVLIALVILSVALAATMPSLVHTVRGTSFSEDTTLAATYAQDKLEQLRRMSFDSPTTTTQDLLAQCNAGTQSEDAPNDDAAFKLYWRVMDADGTTGCDSQVFVIEACAAADHRVDEVCFPNASNPLAAAHFLAVRANY